MLLDDLGEVGRVDDESVVAIVEVLARRFRDVHSEEMRGLVSSCCDGIIRISNTPQAAS